MHGRKRNCLLETNDACFVHRSATTLVPLSLLLMQRAKHLHFARLLEAHVGLDTMQVLCLSKTTFLLPSCPQTNILDDRFQKRTLDQLVPHGLASITKNIVLHSKCWLLRSTPIALALKIARTLARTSLTFIHLALECCPSCGLLLQTFSLLSTLGSRNHVRRACP